MKATLFKLYAWYNDKLIQLQWMAHRTEQINPAFSPLILVLPGLNTSDLQFGKLSLQ